MAPDSHNGLTWRAVVAGVATFFGATGLLAGAGFLVYQGFFLLVGLPFPPYTTTDYLRVAGLFLFDLIVLNLLLYGLTWFVLPVLAFTGLGALGVWLFPSRARTRHEFGRRYDRAWRRLVGKYQQLFQGRIALAGSLVALIVFTFYYHYPVIAQRDIASAYEPCGKLEYAPLPFWPFPQLWTLIDCRRADVRAVILDRKTIQVSQAIYRNAVLWLSVLTLYTLLHPFSQFRATGRHQSLGRRWLWSVTAVLLLLSFTFLPGGYAVLFRVKEAPLVTVKLKEEKDGRRGDWQKQVEGTSWFLMFQGEKEVWLYRPPNGEPSQALILQKEQLGVVAIGDRHWIFVSK